MGIGGVCHTLNPRLSDADISYIADHGQDKVVLVDLTFLPIIGRIWKQLPQVKAWVVLTDRCATWGPAVGWCWFIGVGVLLPVNGGMGLSRRGWC
jgi:hypothetical protein